MKDALNYNSEEDRVLLLNKLHKGGILRTIFSRLLVFIILIALQIGIVVVIYGLLANYLKYFTIFQTIFAIIMIIYLFNSDMDSSPKLTWLMMISLAPFPGSAFLAYTKVNLGYRAVEKNLSTINELQKDTIPHNEDVLEHINNESSGVYELAHYINNTGIFPVYEDTDVTYFPSGEDMHKALLEELSKAKHYIYLEFFIIKEGFMWGSVLKILDEKVKQGVEVKVIYDGTCEIAGLPPHYSKMVQKLGIECKPFLPIHPIISTHYNYRDHRKIVVIDGKVSFTGGVNLGDEYINREEVYGHWKDAAIMLKGDASLSFARMFLQLWNIDIPKPNIQIPMCDGSGNANESTVSKISDDADETEVSQISDDADETKVSKAGTSATESSVAESFEHSPLVFESSEHGYVIPFCDTPLDDYKVGESVYLDLLYRSTEYVYIMTPYLILDDTLESALKFAAERGIDVRLILPGIPDKKVAYSLAKSHYKALLKSGVKIYEYTPGFIHSKVTLCDDNKGVVGSINWDYRSLYHHFECASFLYKTPCIKDIKADFEKTFEECRLVTPETIRNDKLYYKIVGPLIKIIAPLM